MKQKFTSTRELADALKTNTNLQTQFKEDPVSAMESVTKNPLEWDNWVYRIVVMALGITILLIILGVIVLIAVGEVEPKDNEVPTIFTATASAAIGALAGLLAPSPKSQTSEK